MSRRRFLGRVAAPAPPPILPSRGPTPRLEGRSITVRHGAHVAVREVDVRIERGTTVGLVGPNGSGKTSLLRVLGGIASPTTGVALLDGRDLAEMDGAHRAREVAYVGQAEHSEAPFTARQVLSLSRSCLRRDWERATAADVAAVAAVIERMGLRDLADRPLDAMSGGERQRVLIARALAQSTDTMLLDEPTNHLDVAHQQHVLQILAEGPETVLVVLHDLDLAAAFCDRLLMMDEGRLVADGTPGEVLQPDRVRTVYGVAARRVDLDHRPHLVLGR